MFRATLFVYLFIAGSRERERERVFNKDESRQKTRQSPLIINRLNSYI
jgi:hypothetical protein